LKRTEKIRKIYKNGRKRERGSMVQPNKKNEVGLEFDELKCCDPQQGLSTNMVLAFHNSINKIISREEVALVLKTKLKSLKKKNWLKVASGKRRKQINIRKNAKRKLQTIDEHTSM
jgi:hypothetical protein